MSWGFFLVVGRKKRFRRYFVRKIEENSEVWLRTWKGCQKGNQPRKMATKEKFRKIGFCTTLQYSNAIKSWRKDITFNALLLLLLLLALAAKVHSIFSSCPKHHIGRMKPFSSINPHDLVDGLDSIFPIASTHIHQPDSTVYADRVVSDELKMDETYTK